MIRGKVCKNRDCTVSNDYSAGGCRDNVPEINDTTQSKANLV